MTFWFRVLAVLVAGVSAQAAEPALRASHAVLTTPRPRAVWLLAQARALSEIRRKVQSGEALTPEERRVLQRANAEQREQRRKEYLKDHKPQSSTGLVALTDLGAAGYKGEEGGLYPGGKDVPPPAHLKAGLALARRIAPLDAEGRPSPEGKIVLLAIGFSNPNMEFPAFQKLVREDVQVNPRLVTVNGCVGGQASYVIANPDSNYWRIVDERLSQAGVSGNQVEAAWIKLVFPGPSLPFPAESKKLYVDIIGTLHTVHNRFPNLKAAYLSSRTYGGYTEVGGSPEPWAYETGFSVKWAVADQIAGRPELNYDPAKGAVRAPWIDWGPYLWTDGARGRKDGFVYEREDLGEDGLHPSPRGREKIAALLMKFFETDPTTRPWFLK